MHLMRRRRREMWTSSTSSCHGSDSPGPRADLAGRLHYIGWTRWKLFASFSWNKCGIDPPSPRTLSSERDAEVRLLLREYATLRQCILYVIQAQHTSGLH